MVIQPCLQTLSCRLLQLLRKRKSFFVLSTQSKNAVEQILTAITYLRKELGNDQQKIILSVQDDKNGVAEAAVFVGLLTLLEEIDEAFTDLEKYGEEVYYIDIFKTVNELRTKRMQMVHSFEEYKFIYKAISFYTQNKRRFDTMLTQRSSPITPAVLEKREGHQNFSFGEDEDIYLSNPVNVQKALEARRSQTSYR